MRLKDSQREAGFLNEVVEVCCNEESFTDTKTSLVMDQGNVISCPSLVGTGLTEATMRTMVVRGNGPEVLADACRGLYGYTTGAAIGSLLTVDTNSGKVTGARFAPIAEKDVAMFELKFQASKIWPEASSRMEVSLRILPKDLAFSSVASEVKGARGCSEWVDAFDCDSFTITNVGDKGTRGTRAEDPVAVDKSTWKDHEGLKNGACWRLTLEPESTEKTKVRVMMVPVSKEDLIRQTNENATEMSDPALPAISMASNLKMRLFPREASFVSGLGFLPLLYFNTADEELTLPEAGDIKKEFFNLLRDVLKPNIVRADKWASEFAETHWTQGQPPTVSWPAPPAGPVGNPGKRNLV